MLAFAVDGSWAGPRGEAVLSEQTSVEDRAVFDGALELDCLLIRGAGSALTAVYAEGIGAQLKTGSHFTGAENGPSGTLVMIYRAPRKDSAAALLLSSRCAAGALAFERSGAKQNKDENKGVLQPFKFLRSPIEPLPGGGHRGPGVGIAAQFEYETARGSLRSRCAKRRRGPGTAG